MKAVGAASARWDNVVLGESSVEPQKAQALRILPATSFDGFPCLKFPQFPSLCRKKIIHLSAPLINPPFFQSFT